MTNREAIISCFDFINIKPTEDVINKSLDICSKYNVSAEDFVDQWSAYTISNLNGKPPTVDYLVAMERKDYAKKENAPPPKTISTPKNITVYNKAPVEEIDSENVVNAYTCVTPKSNKSAKRLHSPDTGSDPKRVHLLSSSQARFSPASYSPSVSSQSSNYLERGDAGQPVLSFGPDHLLKKATYKRNNDGTTVSVRNYSENILSPDARYMFEVMGKKMASLNSMTQWLGQTLLKKYQLKDVEPFNKHFSNVMTTYGRICCDSNGRLNAASIILEGTRELTAGRCVPLSLKKLMNYSLFPGQTVALRGTNINGTTLVAEQLYTDATPDISFEPTTYGEPLQIIAAAGPFTLKDNISYEPLQDLLKYVITHKPHVVILIGPFLDVSHDCVVDGTIAESFDSFFESLVDSIMIPLKDTNTQVIMVSSCKDAHHHIVYPTPPYTTKQKYENLHYVSDPSMIDIEGLIVGVTSADILFHLGKEEICGPQSGDRMGRFATHVLSQQNFYPLYPPDKEMCIDHDLLERFGTFSVTPHILLLPSNFRCFVKNINGCIVVNPERISKGFIGGTFARIQVQPGAAGSIINDIACQVVRI